MKIAVHGKDFQGQSSRFIEKVFGYLKAHKSDIHVSAKLLRQLKSSRFDVFKLKSFDHGDNLKNLDLFISMGGDGTLLESVTFIGKHEVPILGINTGRMGFLATISRDETEKAIEDFFKGNFKLDARTLLKLTSDSALFDGLNYALNDCTIIKKDTSSMITVHVYVNGELLNSYWSDGVIISTPTGSTGYSLSCGGPIVYPESQSFVITPVSPHTLTARPIILSDDSEITFKIEGRSKKFLISLDSRVEFIDETVKLKISRESFKVKLVQLPGHHYFRTLRQKLNWGLDVRN